MKDRKPISNKLFTAQGSNDLNAVASYKFRKLYKEKYLPIKKPYEKSLIDFWYEKPFFGKISSEGDAIFLSETNLKQLKVEGGRKTLFAADFVADAFSDLQYHFMEAAFQRKIKTEQSPYAKLQPQIGWSPVNIMYHNYLTAIYQSFLQSYVTSVGAERRIRNFGDFVKMFMLFLRDVGLDFPFTRTGFILSNRCPNNISGLIIDLAGKSCGADAKKVKDYIKDNNFRFFRDSAKNFGFMVDRNAPWRLVADLSSPKMKEYMKNYGEWSSSNEMVQRYYYRSHLLDIEMMKSYIIEFYNSFALELPYTSCPAKLLSYGDVGSQGAKERIIKKTIFRQQITKEQVNRFYGAPFWLKTYLHIRMHESGAAAHWSKDKFKTKTRKVLEYYKVFDFNTAVGYINDWAKAEMKINVAKFRAGEKSGGISPSDIQKAQDREVDLGPMVDDIVSGYTKGDQKPDESVVGFSNVYGPPVD